jgi:hypothetical protein
VQAGFVGAFDLFERGGFVHVGSGDRVAGYVPIEANGVPWIRRPGDSEFFVFFQVFGEAPKAVSADRKLTLVGKLTRDGSCAPARSIDVRSGNRGNRGKHPSPLKRLLPSKAQPAR